MPIEAMVGKIFGIRLIQICILVLWQYGSLTGTGTVQEPILSFVFSFVKMDLTCTIHCCALIIKESLPNFMTAPLPWPLLVFNHR
jgi:hypothetical protein